MIYKFFKITICNFKKYYKQIKLIKAILINFNLTRILNLILKIKLTRLNNSKYRYNVYLMKKTIIFNNIKNLIIRFNNLVKKTINYIVI